MATTTSPSITSGSDWLPDPDRYELGMAKSKVDKAFAEFEQGKAQLYRKDGTPKYAPAEHNERVTALLEPLNEAVKVARETATAVRSRCDIEAKAQDTDPLLRLTASAEPAEVSYKMGIIADDVAKMPLPALAQRLEAIMLHGTKAEKLLYVRYARPRVDEVRRQVADSKSSTVPDGMGAAMRAVDDLEKATVDPKMQAQMKRVEQRRGEAMDLSLYAGKRLSDLDGSADSVRQRMMARF